VKIDKPGKPMPANLVGGLSTSTKGKSKPAPSVEPTNSTSVSLGSTATQLSNLENAPVVDTNKVAQIKQAISEGRFKVNSGVVADRLIETVRNLVVSGK
jgi:negative regulator of flagellin synthesis FlgM